MARAPNSKRDAEQRGTQKRDIGVTAKCNCGQGGDCDDYLAACLTLTAGGGVINATLQMMLSQSVAFGEGIRAAHHSASLARTAELAALGTMLGQMFPSRQQVRELAVQRTVTQAPPMLAVS